jgi:hypothetical protein
MQSTHHTPDSGEWIDVTPDLARTWLLLVPETQRRESVFVVNKYAKTMRDGGWRETAEPITFDTDGGLIQGKHRLMALVIAGVTIRFLVVRGMPKDSFAVLDIGRPRTAAQFMSGTYQYAIVTAARLLWAVETGVPAHENFKVWKTWPLDDQIAYVKKWPELETWAALANATSRRTRIGSKFLLAVAAQAERTSHAKHLPLFFEGLKEGEAHDWRPVGDPRGLLRSKFMSPSAPAYNSVPNLIDAGYSMAVKAWNAYALEQDTHRNHFTVRGGRDRRSVVVGGPVDFRTSPVVPRVVKGHYVVVESAPENDEDVA